MPFVPDLLHPPRTDLAPQQAHGPELSLAPQHDVSGKYKGAGQRPKLLLHFIAHQTPGSLSPSDRALKECIPSYAGNHDFLDFIEAAQIRLVLRKQVEDEYVNGGGTLNGHPIKFSGRTYVTDARCPEMAFGYPTDYYSGELAEQAGNDPYKYYDLYIATAKKDPQKLTQAATNEYQRELVTAMRKVLGATQAAELASKKIPGDKLDDFLAKAATLMTKHQVDELAAKYVSHGQ